MLLTLKMCKNGGRCSLSKNINSISDLDCRVNPTMSQGQLITNCTNHIWRDQRHRWKRGCERLGRRANSIFQCALTTNTDGLALIKANCLSDNPKGCNMDNRRLKRNPSTDYIYD